MLAGDKGYDKGSLWKAGNRDVGSEEPFATVPVLVFIQVGPPFEGKGLSFCEGSVMALTQAEAREIAARFEYKRSDNKNLPAEEDEHEYPAEGEERLRLERNTTGTTRQLQPESPYHPTQSHVMRRWVCVLANIQCGIYIGWYFASHVATTPVYQALNGTKMLHQIFCGMMVHVLAAICPAVCCTYGAFQRN